MLDPNRSSWKAYRPPKMMRFECSVRVSCYVSWISWLNGLQLVGSFILEPNRADCQGHWCRRRLPSPTTLTWEASDLIWGCLKLGCNPPAQSTFKRESDDKASHLLGRLFSDTAISFRQFLMISCAFRDFSILLCVKKTSADTEDICFWRKTAAGIWKNEASVRGSDVATGGRRWLGSWISTNA